MAKEDIISSYMRQEARKEQERTAMAKEDMDAGRFNRRKVRGDVMLNEDLLRLILSYTRRPEARRVMTQLVREVPDLMRIMMKNGTLAELGAIVEERDMRTNGVVYDGQLYHALGGGDNIAFKGHQDYFDWENWGRLNDFKKRKVEYNGRSWIQEDEDFVDMEAQVDRFNAIVEPYGFELGWFRLQLENSENADKLSSYASMIDADVRERKDRRDRVRQRKEEKRAKRKEERRAEREEEEESDDDEDEESVEEENESEGEIDLDDITYDVGFWGVRGLSDKAKFLSELHGIAQTTTDTVRLDAEREQMSEEDRRSREIVNAYAPDEFADMPELEQADD